VISDLHLSSDEPGQGLFGADEALEQFLLWVVKRTHHCTVVLNGDVLDFLFAESQPGLDADKLERETDAIIERAARALRPGRCLGMVAFHVDQWKETGKVSRFAYDEARMERSLKAQGLVPEALEVEREVKRFASVEEGLAAAVGLEDAWRADGRWFRYIAFLEGGGRTLTRAHLIVTARKS